MSFTHELESARKPDDAMPAFLAEVVPAITPYGFQVTEQRPDGLSLTKRYLPTWALIAGILTFPIGILFWALVRNTDAINVSFIGSGSKTRVVMSGTGPRELLAKLIEMRGSAQG